MAHWVRCLRWRWRKQGSQGGETRKPFAAGVLGTASLLLLDRDNMCIYIYIYSTIINSTAAICIYNIYIYMYICIYIENYIDTMATGHVWSQKKQNIVYPAESGRFRCKTCSQIIATVTCGNHVCSQIHWAILSIKHCHHQLSNFMFSHFGEVKVDESGTWKIDLSLMNIKH